MNKPIICVGFMFLACLAAGCAQARIPFFGKSSRQPTAVQPQSSEHSVFVKKGRIVDQSGFSRAANVAVIPFKAGINVEAGGEMDKTALMIVRGVADTFERDLNGERMRLHIVTAQNSGDAQLMVQGHITDMIEPSLFKRWLLFGRKKSLGVEGKVIDVATGETVAVFNDSVKTSIHDDTFPQLGYRIGQNIGRFILSAI